LPFAHKISTESINKFWVGNEPFEPEIVLKQLVKVCIEYVIIHELCHLIYRDHTQKFLDLQTIEMPDWEK